MFNNKDDFSSVISVLVLIGFVFYFIIYAVLKHIGLDIFIFKWLSFVSMVTGLVVMVVYYYKMYFTKNNWEKKGTKKDGIVAIILGVLVSGGFLIFWFLNYSFIKSVFLIIGVIGLLVFLFIYNP